ncbi:Methyltransferase domain-containing protein [Rubritalea squalenifaciens DSM 18772]|uniref:Methyltransferase domain-containing protein n=1 Tax=Rubritalea squalenifaciens DSM 18772 TaxID=1123071 RepID=A0A1M6GJ92_9BACT|nr:class I SAM-dependent methyltransferase [Rubritalea squalenifaciens]SHJ09988.1 Methyltransferase domain-containing protein [Rubritalea squalenifaciens DSM 18772]
MDLDFSNQHTESDLDTLHTLLDSLLRPYLKSELSNLRILNLACGRADETGVLHRILSPCAAELTMIGVDIRDREIAEANLRWKSLQGAQAAFLVQDASKLHQVDELSQPFDVAFMRHQNFWNGDLTWHRIYDQALHSLKSEGLLIITSYFDREHFLALQAIQSLGAKLVHTIRNPHSRPLPDAPGKSVDRHIAIFKL